MCAGSAYSHRVYSLRGKYFFIHYLGDIKVTSEMQDVNSEETARSAPAADAVRIQNMNNQIRQLERRIGQTGTRRRKARGSRMRSLAAEESHLR